MKVVLNPTQFKIKSKTKNERRDEEEERKEHNTHTHTPSSEVYAELNMLLLLCKGPQQKPYTSVRV